MAQDVRRAAVRLTPARTRAAATRRYHGRPLALTGTPGVGKTAVARALNARVRAVEVYALASERGCARKRGGTWEVDVGRLVRSLHRRPLQDVDLIVGHLAHFLPVRGAVVLRCQPLLLLRRLTRARRGSRRDRRENAIAEALDLVAVEVRTQGLPCYEVDTTARTVASVARSVQAIARGRIPSRPPHVDWLADPSVTAHLLDADL